jgi:hypothetical protein
MQDAISARLAELKHDFELGEARLRELEAQQAQLRDTLLRISGAIQVLEEVRQQSAAAAEPAAEGVAS